MRQSVVLIVLREVETHLFTKGRHTHGDQTVDKRVTQPTHGEGIDEHDDDGEQVVEEDHKTFPCACNETLLNEDTSQHRTEDTTRAVRGEYVEGIVDVGMRTPIDGDVTDQRDDKGDEDALSHGDVACRWRDGHQTDNTTHGSTHGRRFTTAQTVEENPRHHGRSRGGIRIQERLDGLSVGMQRRTRIEAKPTQPQHGSTQKYKGDVGWFALTGLRLAPS